MPLEIKVHHFDENFLSLLCGYQPSNHWNELATDKVALMRTLWPFLSFTQCLENITTLWWFVSCLARLRFSFRVEISNQLHYLICKQVDVTISFFIIYFYCGQISCISWLFHWKHWPCSLLSLTHCCPRRSSGMNCERLLTLSRPGAPMVTM